MVSFTSIVASVASLAVLSNAFSLQVRRSGDLYHLTSVSVNSDNKLVIGGGASTEFTLSDNELHVEGTNNIVFVSDSDGSAVVADRCSGPAGYSSVTFSNSSGYLEFNEHGPTYTKTDNIAYLHWSSSNSGNPISLVAL